MNQGRVWCVVPPAVGLPLLIGSAAVTSLVVHASVLTHTTWFSAYWNGAAGKAKVADAGSISSQPGFAINIAPAEGAAGATSFVVTLTPTAPAEKSVALNAPAAK